MIQRQFQGQGTIGNVTEQGVQLDEARPDTDNVARSFEIFLNQTLRGIYVTFTKALDEDLRRVVEPAIFHQDSAFLTHNQPYVPILLERNPAPTMSYPVIRSAALAVATSLKFYSSPFLLIGVTDPLRRRVPFKMGHITVEDVVELLSTTLELLRKANVFDAVVAQVCCFLRCCCLCAGSRVHGSLTLWLHLDWWFGLVWFGVALLSTPQCFHHGIYFISAYLFNELLERKDLCRPQIAFQIKMSVSVIAGWVGTQGALLETAAYVSLVRDSHTAPCTRY